MKCSYPIIMGKKRIFLWSTRRTLSMAFHRAIYQLDGIKHFCEPFVLPHYFGPEKRSVQFANDQEVATRFGRIPTYAECLNNITEDYEGYHTTFIKEHAMRVWPDKVPREVLHNSFHAFIIRNPEKAIKSVYRQILVDFKESLWSHIVPEELGFREQLLMYKYITGELNMKVFVIDADDLLRNPREVMERFCNFVGLQFSESMLDWSTDDAKKEDKPWDFLANSWIKDVKETNGFRKMDKVQDTGIEYPQFIYNAISDNMKYYNELKSHKVEIGS